MTAPAHEMERDGVSIPPVALILLAMGAMCPQCGSGTRAASKKWAKCKQCGLRVPRHQADDQARGPTVPTRTASGYSTQEATDE